MDTVKVLSIGNSFSQDAHKWLHKLAEINGFDIETANLFIGGCGLQTHWKNVQEDNAHYELELNGNNGERKISIKEALKSDRWDIITLQQVSHLSGLPETYEPYLFNLAEFVKKEQPNAKLYFHQTWAYEIDSNHSGFVNYNKDQRKMYECIIKTTEAAAKQIGAEMIPVGRVIQKLRETVKDFDYRTKGLSLCRDGFHLSLDYGRYAAAATWFTIITDKKVQVTEFEGFDVETLKLIVDTVNTVCYK